jgi:hypothetical protein
MGLWRVGVALAGLSLACAAPARAPLPPAAPALAEPALALPADLDLVVRLDLTRLRAALGLSADALASRLGESAPGDEPDRDTARLLFALFTRAETLWVAVRPGLSAELTDFAVALRGDFRNVVPSLIGGEPRWSLGRDMGRGILRFTRDPPRLRAAPAVLYLRLPDVVVLGSVAEIDALERSVELGPLDTPLRAPETGLIAAAARLGSLRQRLARRAPTLTGYVAGAQRLEASFERQGEGFRLRVDVSFEQSSQVSSLVDSLRALQEKLRSDGNPWVDKLVFEPLERNLSARVDLTGPEIARLVGCLSRPGC